MPFTNAFTTPFQFSTSYEPIFDYDTHAYARLWEIKRTDGIFHRFTDVDHTVEFLGNDYFPATDPDDLNDGNTDFRNKGVAPSPTARQRKDQMSRGDMQLSGSLSVDGIQDEDIRSGKFRDAVILERIVDRRWPWGGIFDTQEMLIVDTQFDGDVHVLQCESLTTRLRTRFGEVYAYECPYELGILTVGLCQKDITSLLISGTISVATDRRTISVFSASWGGSNVNNWAGKGWIQFTNNPLLTGRIFTILNSTDPVSSVVNLVLAQHLPADAVIGNTVTVAPGCDKTLGTCITKFDNKDNFGAWPFIPGTDRAILNPSLT